MGWALDVAALRGSVASVDYMRPNTAVAFLLGGVSLWLLLAPQRPPWSRAVAHALAGGAGLIGAATLVEHLLGSSLGIDQLLFRDELRAVESADPGRLPVQSALNFALVGAALILLDRGSRARVLTQRLSGLAAAVALFSLLGYAYRADGVDAAGAFTPIAPLAAIAFLVLAAGITCARPDSGLVAALAGDRFGSIMARRLLPAGLGLLALLGWLRLEGERAGLYDSDEGVAIMVAAFIALLVVGVLATARVLNRIDDERRRSAAEQGRLAAVVASSDDAIVSGCPDGEILSWNAGAERLYGYPAAAMLGKPLWSLTPGDPGEEIPRLLAAVAHERRTERHEAVHVREDGREIDVSLTLSPVCDDSGELVGYSMIARDISERKRAERATLDARAEAERANLAKSEFLSRMSHELRTPLNAILGFGQLLEGDGLDTRQREHVGYIVKGGRHLLELINEVLDISRIEAGRLSVSLEPVCLETAVREACGLVEPAARERRIELRIEGGDNGDRYAVADLQRLKQVLLNLLSNAVKYNRAGGSVSISIDEAEPERLRISVADTGRGIPPQALERLFEPFERLGAEQSGVEGAGLGLALSKRLAEAMGGTIEVESEPGVGSVFSLELVATAVSAAEPPALAMAPFPRVPQRQLERTVLYVEDNLSNFRLVEQILEQRPGIELLTAMQGRLGVDLARQQQPALILLDLHLPDIPGSAVLEQLKADPRTERIPVVIVSADATPNQLERLLAAGAADYLTKPLDVARFLSVVDRELSCEPALAS